VAEVAPGVFVATAAMYSTTTTVVVGADGGCLVIDPAVTPGPLLDLSSADPFGSYRAGLSRLASLSGVRVVVPGHGHVGDAATFRSRVAADFAYLDALAAGADVEDPRLAGAADWLRADHARQVTAARDAIV
jgi:glyoxylase-like metal-dependent hydrolase (beta-lactamase superfamily II)